MAQCLSPLNIRDPSKTGNGKIISVPCGRCLACLSNKRDEWTIRLEHELRNSMTAKFVTLTYDDAELIWTDSGRATLSKYDVQLFMKRFRKTQQQKIKYYLVGEYGTRTHRPHYHAIIFNVNDDIQLDIDKTWAKGLTHIGTVNIKSITYTCKYVINKYDVYEGVEPPFSLMSKGLGKSYIDKNGEHYKKRLQPFIVKENGIKHALPRYYKDKIFSTYQRKKMAKNALSISDKMALEKYEDYKEKNPNGNYYVDINDRKEAYKRLVNSRTKNQKL